MCVAAAGHAAGFVVKAVAAGKIDPATMKALVLVAPTFKGPLPTASTKMGMGPAMSKLFCETFDAMNRAPLIGHALHTKFTSAPWIAKQLKAHVYADPCVVTPLLVDEKRNFARSDRPRRMAVSFVSGRLDAFGSVDEAVACVAGVAGSVATTVLIPHAVPATSRAGMESMASVDAVIKLEIMGELLPQEEHPDSLTAAVAETLRKVGA